MKVERVEQPAINVHNLEDAIKLYSDILETEFEIFEDSVIEKITTDDAKPSEGGTKIRIALDRTGFFELVENDPPVAQEGLRNIHVKVPDIEEAIAELKSKGIRLLARIKIGSFKEAICNPDDLHGVRLCLVEYDTPSLVEAFYKK